MAFPTSLTNAQNNVTDVDASHINALEAKVGIDSSAVTTSHDYKLSGITSTAKAVSNNSTETIAGVKTFSSTPKMDAIAENSSGVGVTIDGVLIKDDLDTSSIVTKTTAQVISGVKSMSAGMKFTEQSAPATPSANDVHVYAKDKSGVSRLYYKDDGGTENEVGGTFQTKVVYGSRDITASTADVGYTGVGFTPKALIVWAWVNTGTYWAFGMAGSGPTQGGITGSYNGTEGSIAGPSNTTTYILRMETGGTEAGQTMALKSFDADGFTITWTKNGSPGANTIGFFALCLG